MGNNFSSSENPNSILSTSKEDMKLESDLMEYRWFWGEKLNSWEGLTGKEKWNIFPLEISEKIEQAYVNKFPFEYGEKIILFHYDDSKHVQIKVKNPWKHKLILKEIPCNISIIRKSIINKFNPVPLNNDTVSYHVQLTNKFRIITNYEIFDQFDLKIKEKNLIKKFIDFYFLSSNKVYHFMNEEYQLYIKKKYSEFCGKKLTIDVLKKMLIKDFSSNRLVFIKYYICNINENNFCKIITTMFLEESYLYQDLLEFTSSCSYSNIDLTTYYLCLIFSLNELNQQKPSINSYSTFYYSENVFIPKKYYFSTDFLITSKKKFNISEPEGDNKLIEIFVHKPPHKNSFFNITPIDLQFISPYQDEIVVFPNNSIFYCKKVTENKVDFVVIQDYVSSTVPFMSGEEKTKYGIYEDFSNFDGDAYHNVIVAKLKSRNIKNSSRMTNVRAIDIFGNDIKIEGMLLLSSNFCSCPNLISLSIIGSNVNYEGFKSINDNLKHIPFLKYLNLSYNIIKDLEIEQITFEAIPQLETLILRENQITSKGMLHLSNQLSAFCPYLRILDLYDNLIGDDGMVIFCEKADKLKYIESLDFWNCGITDIGMNSFTTSILNGNLSQIEKINLKNNQISEKVLANIIEAVKNLKYLSYLNLSQTKLSDNEILDILKELLLIDSNWKYNNNSGELCVFNEDEIKEEINEISNKSGPIDTKVSTGISNQQIFGKGFRKKKRKKSYMIQEMKFSSQNLKALIKNTENFNNVKSFNFSESNIGDEGFKNFLIITFQLPSIEQVNFSFNELTPLGMEHFASYAFYLKNLKHLDLSSNNIGDKGMKNLSEGVSKCPKLESVVLCWNKIGDKGLKMLISYLNSIKNLKNLDLYGNIITDDGFSHFSQVSYCIVKRIQSLNFGKNQIGNEGMKSFSTAFQKFTSLSHLNLSGNTITDEGLKDFTSNIQLVLNLSSLNISDNPISDQMRDELLQQGFPSNFIIE